MTPVHRVLVVAVLVFASAFAAQAMPSTVSSDGVRLTLDADDSSAMGSNVKLMFRIYQECTLKDGGLMPCIKMRAITFFDRVARLESIPLVDSVQLVRVAGEDRTSRAMSEPELEASLPRDVVQRDTQLTSLLMERVSRFFRSYSLKVSLPDVTEGDLARGLEEGRGKMKKMMGMMMLMGGALKFGLLMLLKLKGLFFLAKKALIISKIALVLALVVALKKLLSGGGKGGGGGGYESGGHGGWQSGGGGGGGGWDRRALEAAHDLAYSAQKPVPAVPSVKLG